MRESNRRENKRKVDDWKGYMMNGMSRNQSKAKPQNAVNPVRSPQNTGNQILISRFA